MNRILIISLFSLLMSATLAAPAHALKEPRSLSTDGRIKVVMYSPDEIYKFTGHYGFNSSIEFEKDEKIQTVSVGDSLAWLLTPSGSRLFLKPIEQEALTNMTVITDKRTYLFELHAAETDDIEDPNMVFVLRFEYPGANDAGLGDFRDPVPNPAEDENPEKYNFNYTISGPETVSPIRIFDDGEFTYFQFRDKNADVPAFFLVDAQGNESLINFRTRDDYIVVERVAARYTLRKGTDVVCVFNEALPLGKQVGGR